MRARTCEIINDTFSWRLVVDGENISFNSRSGAEYFASHYLKLGYVVIFGKVDGVNKDIIYGTSMKDV